MRPNLSDDQKTTILAAAAAAAAGALVTGAATIAGDAIKAWREKRPKDEGAPSMATSALVAAGWVLGRLGWPR